MPKMKNLGTKQERRNGHAFHPIMSKGGVHEKTEKAKRKAAKHDMSRKVQEWLGRPSHLGMIAA
jgi:hypothetical protein